MFAGARAFAANRWSRLIFFVALAGGIAALGRAPNLPGSLTVMSDRLHMFSTIFQGIFIEAVPFLLLGTLASGIVEVFVNREELARYIPRDAVRGVMAGALLGFCFPVCECGVVPLTRRLFNKGMPLHVGVAFLLAAPALNPIVIVSTYTAFGFGPILLARIGLTILIALFCGLVFSFGARPERVLLPAAWPVLAGGSASVAHVQSAPVAQRLSQVVSIAADEFFEMGSYLLVGAALAAGLQALVPQSLLLGLSTGPLVSVLALVLLAVVLSICSTVDAFIALAFAGSFTTGSVLAFLVFGPMVDIKSIVMYSGVFKRRTVGYLVMLPLLLTVLAAVFINLNLNW
ncbi:MAG: permease [Chloroflexi bacterium]|nr:permease [Chloroflexota bacterium]